MIKEFRNFINRGNVVELGVAFVMGASFKSLVDVFTKRLIEPLINQLFNYCICDVSSHKGLQSF
jgi:large conductance mechanosensitive channel